MKRLLSLLMVAILLAGCTAGSTRPTGSTGGQNPARPTIQPSTQPTTEKMPNSFTGLGGKMPELKVSCADGRTLLISELLQEKELIVLNFWFQNCGWCLKEFPVLELAYQKYQDNVEILALNGTDGADAVKAFAQKYRLSIPLAACSPTLPRNCGVRAYPTSIFIDRNGVVCLIHVGAITTSQAWETLFDAFVGESYSQTIYTNAGQILG